MADFGEILNRWEREEREKANEHPMAEALDRYPPTGAAKREESTRPSRSAAGRTAGRRLPVVETLDLHGATVEEALTLCHEVIRRNARGTERRRILIVHGKGLHSSGPGKLQEVVRRFLKEHPLVGETGVPPAKEGGDGAVWAVCRQRSR